MRDLISSLLMIQFVRFLGVGGFATVLYYAVFISLLDMAGVQYLIASIAAFVPSFTFNFWMSKVWVFRNPDKRAVYRQLVWFTVKHLVAFGLNALFLYILVEWRLSPLPAQLTLTAVYAAVSYFVSRWIFRK